MIKMLMLYMANCKVSSPKNRRINYLIATLCVVLYDLTPSINGFDGYYYIEAGRHFINGEMDCLRTPIYPLFIQLNQLLFDNYFRIGITIFQSVVFLLSVKSLENIIEYFVHNRWIKESVLLMYIVCVAPGWCNELATESFSISGCVILVDILLRYIHQPTTRKALLIFFISILLVFLRPTFLLFFAILPCTYICLLIIDRNRSIHMLSLFFVSLSILAWLGYCKIYENNFGKFRATSTFVCNDVYNLKRGNCWDVETVKTEAAKEVCISFDSIYDNNYGPIYQLAQYNPDKLALLELGCKEMKEAHKTELIKYRIALTVSSFDSRFDASVNTHSVLSSILFFFSLFFSLPLSLFYCVVFGSTLLLCYYILNKREIPLVHCLLVGIMFAQCMGVWLTACDSHNRILLPVYPLSLVYIGYIFEKINRIIRSSK